MKPEERATFILGQLNAGLRTEWSQIEGLEATLEKLLQEAKSRADGYIPSDRRDAWEATWTAVQAKLETLQGCAAQARQRYDAGETTDALEPWDKITGRDRELDELLDTLRTTGREALPGAELEPWYDGWKSLWVTIEDQLSTLRAHIIATRVRLEMRKDYGSEKADEVTRQILARLSPDASLEEAEKYARDFRLAYYEVEEHREHPTLRDIIRALLLLPEDTPEDRLLRHRKAEVVR